MLDVQKLSHLLAFALVIVVLGLFHRTVYETACQPLAWISQLFIGCRDELRNAAQLVNDWAARALLQEGIDGPGTLLARFFGSFLLTFFCFVFIITGADLFSQFISDDAAAHVRQLVSAISPSLTPEFLAATSLIVAAVLWGIVWLDTMGVHHISGFSRTDLSRRIFFILAIANLAIIAYLEISSGAMRGVIFSAPVEGAPAETPVWLGASLWGLHGLMLMTSAAASGLGAASLWVLTIWLLSAIAAFLLTLLRAIAAVIVILWNAASHALLQALVLLLRIAKLLVTPLALWLEPRTDGIEWRSPVGSQQQAGAPAPPDEPPVADQTQSAPDIEPVGATQSANWDGTAGVNTDKASTTNPQQGSN